MAGGPSKLDMNGRPVEAVAGGRGPVGECIDATTRESVGGRGVPGTGPGAKAEMSGPDSKALAGISSTPPVIFDAKAESLYLAQQEARDRKLFEALTSAGVENIDGRFAKAEQLMEQHALGDYSASLVYRDLVDQAIAALETAGIMAVIALLRRVVESQGVHVATIGPSAILNVYEVRKRDAEGLEKSGGIEYAVPIYKEMALAFDRLGDVSRGFYGSRLTVGDIRTSAKSYWNSSRLYVRLVRYYAGKGMVKEANQAKLAMGHVLMKLSSVLLLKTEKPGAAPSEEALNAIKTKAVQAAGFYDEARQVFNDIGRHDLALSALMGEIYALCTAGNWTGAIRKLGQIITDNDGRYDVKYLQYELNRLHKAKEGKSASNP